MPYADRSRDTSDALVEVRTVHSRALSALDRIMSDWGGTRYDDPDIGPRPTQREGESRDEYNERWRTWFDAKNAAQINMTDPDYDEMVEALTKVVELLEPWKKAGARRRR